MANELGSGRLPLWSSSRRARGELLVELLAHILDLAADLLDEVPAAADLVGGDAELGGVALDGLHGGDEVGEVLGEGAEGGLEVVAGGGELGRGGGGGERADAEVRGEEGARRRELREDISARGVRPVYSLAVVRGWEEARGGSSVVMRRTTRGPRDGGRTRTATTYCWTWRKGSSSLVEDIILAVRLLGCASACLGGRPAMRERAACEGDCGGRLVMLELGCRFVRLGGRPPWDRAGG